MNNNNSDDKITQAIQALITLCDQDPTSFDGELVAQMIQTSLKLMVEGHDTGQLKLMTRALKEMRYAYRIFNQYKGSRRISIFGSARTPEDHPDYLAAKEFSSKIAEQGWMCITGAANGIMKAGLEGPKKELSFGLSIRLPFEVPTNSLIEGDIKLITFRYFFTRKLMFLSHSHAVAVFPGGFGTLDELFEALTLIQTGKANIVPIVLLQGQDGVYWHHWKHYIEDHLLANGWISPEDERLFFIAPSVEEGVHHILKFYRRFHSCRYVKDTLVIRMLEPLSDNQLQQLNEEFSSLVKSGQMKMNGPLPEEDDYLELPRLIFQHTRNQFGRLRMLIDQINEFPMTATKQVPLTSSSDMLS